MRDSSLRNFILPWLIFFILVSISCSVPTTTPVPDSIPSTPSLPVQQPENPTSIPIPTPAPPRLLTVCLGNEPVSLLPFADTSPAANSVRQAIYDGPIDIRAYRLQPVIVERIPDLANGDALLEPVQVISNTLIADSQGSLANLSDGVSYLPAGCSQADCAQTYTGSAPAILDQLVVRFRLRPGLLWSDGAPLTAGDSVYSFEVAKALYPRTLPALLDNTQSYTALDETTVEWRGVPGYKDPAYQTFFFTPLPRHAWGGLSPQDLLTSEVSNRAPVGWGPYLIDEWVAGDHITLSKNPNYFRTAEGFPYYDRMVFRFTGGGETALNALLAGECDLLDSTAVSDIAKNRLLELQEEGKLKAIVGPGMAWEHLDFNLAPIDPEQPNLFQSKELRKAIALCIDRKALIQSLFFDQPVDIDTYLPPSHPQVITEVSQYTYDPQAAASLLTSAGWIDADGNPQSARVAQGVAGIPDGTPLAFTYQTLGGGERQVAAQMIRDGLSGCGIQANLQFTERETLFAPGPDGPVFGRRFQASQFGWPTALQPTCSLYVSSEIPGPYPQYPKGWAGANATGYNNPAFDQACQRASLSLPDSPSYLDAHRQAQALFTEDLPVIPLYIHLTWGAARINLCGPDLQAAVENLLWNLETWEDGDAPACVTP